MLDAKGLEAARAVRDRGYPNDTLVDQITAYLQAVGPEPAVAGREKLNSAVDAVFAAVIDCPHEIEAESITLRFSPNKGGHNALFQLSGRIRSALVATPPAEPVVEARNYETFRTFAHEATKAITNLTGGGSEYFGKEVDGVFLADLPRCVERLRDRIARVALATKSAVKDDETVVEAPTADVMDAGVLAALNSGFEIPRSTVWSVYQAIRAALAAKDGRS